MPLPPKQTNIAIPASPSIDKRQECICKHGRIESPRGSVASLRLWIDPRTCICDGGDTTAGITLGDEIRLSSDSTLHFTAPIWRPDCERVAFLRVAATAEERPDIRGEIIIGFPRNPGTTFQLRTEPHLANNLRYSPIPFPGWFGGSTQFLLSWRRNEDTATLQAGIYVTDDSPISSIPSLVRPQNGPTFAIEPDFGEWKVPSIENAAADDMDSFWIIHEEGLGTGPPPDATGRSLVSVVRRPRQTPMFSTKTKLALLSQMQAAEDGQLYSIFEKPKPSPRRSKANGQFSFGYIMTYETGSGDPQTTSLVTRYGFSQSLTIPPLHLVTRPRTGRSVSEVAWSPNGQHFTFVVRSGGPEKSSHIWVGEFPREPERPGVFPLLEGSISNPIAKVWRVSVIDHFNYSAPSWNRAGTHLIYVGMQRRIPKAVPSRAIPVGRQFPLIETQRQLFVREVIPRRPDAKEILVSTDTERDHGFPSFSPCSQGCFALYSKVTSGPMGLRRQVWMRRLKAQLCGDH